MNYITLGQNIRTARRAAGFTQEEVSQVLNVARNSVIAIERGQYEILESDLKLLSSFFNMPIEDLTKGCRGSSGDVLRVPGFTLNVEPDHHYAHLTDDERDLINAVRQAEWMDAIEMIAQMRRGRAEIE